MVSYFMVISSYLKMVLVARSDSLVPSSSTGMSVLHIQKRTLRHTLTWSKVFYEFLVNSFRDAPGLSFVLSQQFRVMNGYNNYPITQEAWQAVIQPKAKIIMAMVVSNTRKLGSCPDPSCSGRVTFTLERVTYIW